MEVQTQPPVPCIARRLADMLTCQHLLIGLNVNIRNVNFLLRKEVINQGST